MHSYIRHRVSLRCIGPLQQRQDGALGALVVHSNGVLVYSTFRLYPHVSSGIQLYMQWTYVRAAIPPAVMG